MFVAAKFDGASIGAVYSSLGIAMIFMPTLLGIVADKWLSARNGSMPTNVMSSAPSRYSWPAEVTYTFGAMFFVILLNNLAYMPTLKLINTTWILMTDFPPIIRIWSCIGFILAMWA
ncbi:hypothetical protein KCP73_16820 [Salmonella enterica subsp. enterica]|nr:hypothetical protein KCP73_16820 [Salmonella enterica subsp. enterica]